MRIDSETKEAKRGVGAQSESKTRVKEGREARECVRGPARTILFFRGSTSLVKQTNSSTTLTSQQSVSLLDTPAVFDSLPTLPSVGADTARCTLGESLLETNLYETKVRDEKITSLLNC